MFQNKLPLMCMYHNLVNLGLVYISWNGKLSSIEWKKKLNYNDSNGFVSMSISL